MNDNNLSIAFTATEVPDHRPIRPAFGYYGAKQRLAKRIIESLPPHNAWVEAFCGSAAITLAKQPAPIEIINDMDGEIVNLFDQIRNNSDELCRVISLTPYARAEYQRSRSGNEILQPLERARRFLIAAMMTVNGIADPRYGKTPITSLINLKNNIITGRLIQTKYVR